jgi:hypothetical protein
LPYTIREWSKQFMLVIYGARNRVGCCVVD